MIGWRGKMSELVGDKLIAIVPVLGWWDQRKLLKMQELKFSLVLSIQRINMLKRALDEDGKRVFGPGVYAAIKPRVEAEAQITIDV